MTGHQPTIAEVFSGQRLIPVLHAPDVDRAIGAVQALVDGGLAVIEIVLRTDAALQAVRAVSTAVPEAVIGVGTVRTPAELRAAVEAGAQFVVSPGTSARLYDAAAALAVAFLPGASTVTEVLDALDCGFETVKIFPAAQLGGPSYLDALSAVTQPARFVPTGGIGALDAAGYLSRASVVAVGGSFVCPSSLVAAHDWPAITVLAAAAARHSR